jgi:hypothetical protein
MVGEMKQWVFESQDVIKVFEMKQSANVELALKRLEDKEKSGSSLLLEYQPGPSGRHDRSACGCHGSRDSQAGHRPVSGSLISSILSYLGPRTRCGALLFILDLLK